MVEMALVTPILLLLILGMVQAGFGMLTSLQLHHAAQQGALAGCADAAVTVEAVYGSVPDGVECEQLGDLVEVRLSDAAPMIGPFGRWVIRAEARAVMP